MSVTNVHRGRGRTGYKNNVLKAFYSKCDTLDRFVDQTLRVSAKVKNIPAELEQWMKKFIIAIPPNCETKHFDVGVVNSSLENEILRKIQEQNRDNAINTIVVNEDNKLLQRKKAIFCHSYWKSIHRFVGDKLMYYMLTECAIFNRESSTLIQISGFPIEKEYFKKLKNATKSLPRPRKSGDRGSVNLNVRKRKRSNYALGECSNPKRRKFGDSVNGEISEISHKKTRRGKCKKRQAEEILPGYLHSLPIPRYRMFYIQANERFPSKHILAELSQNTSSIHINAFKLKKAIFNVKVTNQNDDYWTILLMTFERSGGVINHILEKFIENHKSFDYIRTAQRNCHVAKLQRYRKPKNPNEVVELDVKCYNTWSQVLNFLRIILYKVVPKELLGSNHNQRIMYKNLKKLICAGKWDKLCLGEAMRNFKVKDCKWVKNEGNISQREHLVATVVFWLITEYFMAILRSFFYITDSASNFQQLFYYRQHKWKCLCRRQFNEVLQSKLLRLVDEKDAELMTGKTDGIGKLRFLPKTVSLRPIVNQQYKGENTKRKEEVKSILSALRYITAQNPDLLGFSRTNVNNVMNEWKDFAIRAKKNGLEGKLHFVKIDVKDCFNSMLQKKLLRILDDIITNFYEKLSGSTDPKLRDKAFLKIAKVIEVCSLNNTLKRRQVYIVSEGDESFKVTIDKHKKMLQRAVVNDTGKRRFINEIYLKKKLKQYISYALTKYEKQLYHQTNGIVQGSVLSTFLCNLYYGSLDQKHLKKFVEDENDFLIRYVDDYFYVTPNSIKARYFYASMMNGFKDYNCTVNQKKSFNSFNEKATEICLLGYKIDVKNFSVSADYSRFWDQQMIYTISFRSSRPGVYLKDMLRARVRANCTAVLMDENCNSVAGVAQNVYELFYISAFRMFGYVKNLPLCRGPEKCSKFFMSVIVDCTKCMYSLLRSMKRRKKISSSLSRSDVICLCCLAFETKFEGKQRFRYLLKKVENLRMKMSVHVHDELIEELDRQPIDFKAMID